VRDHRSIRVDPARPAPTTPGHVRRPWRLRWLAFIVGLIGLGVVMAKDQAPGGETQLVLAPLPDALRINSVDLALPDSEAPADAGADPMAASERHTLTVRPGDTAALMLRRAGVAGTTIQRLIRTSEHGDDLAHLRPGQQLHMLRAADGRLDGLVHQISAERSLRFERDGDAFTSRVIEVEAERRFAHATGVIQTSLFAAGTRAGLDRGIILDLAEIFAWDIDFALDIRRGDRFRVVYETFHHDGKLLRTGDIVAAEFVNQGRRHRALRYTDPTGSTAYYAPDGSSIRRAFLRAPVEYTRITSGFGPRRHPELHRMRNHNGVDYAAPTGTPIRATGDGRITLRGWRGGYGRTVVIQHGERYSTLYAHLAGFRQGRGVGARVEQGDIIGYVGSSGLATGPHIHYEFRIDGRHRNPQTVALPEGEPVDPAHREHFNATALPLVAKLDTLARFASAIGQ